jgi:hypothetical protein
MNIGWLRDAVASRVHVYSHHSTADEDTRRRHQLEAEQRELENRVRVAEALRDALIIARNR